MYETIIQYILGHYMNKKPSIYTTLFLSLPLLLLLIGFVSFYAQNTNRLAPIPSDPEKEILHTSGSDTKTKADTNPTPSSIHSEPNAPNAPNAPNVPTHLAGESYGLLQKSHLLKDVDLSNPTSRANAVKKIKAIEEYEKILLKNQLESSKHALPISGEVGQWGQWQLFAIDPKTGYKRIKITHDAEATIAVNAASLATTHFATGLGVKVGVWDAGGVRTNHQEYRPRATIKDGSRLSSHATLVAGIIASKGVRASAEAIALEANIDSYNWDNEFSKLVAAAASSVTETNKLGVSNHSYGYITGWETVGTDYVYYGDWNFGIYGIGSQESDSLAHAAPYFLMVRSAGNDRDDNPAPGSSIRLDDWSPVESYNPTIHPLGDGIRKQGYDTISEAAAGKNILTVGAVTKGILNNQRDVTKALMASFSSWGPTDDGRIKPDVVASGVGLHTTASGSNTAYNTNFTGTSASTPLVTSIIASLTHKYRTLSGNYHMRSSTMKAILIAGADDLGTKGPDYQFGHGHVNALSSLQIIERWVSSPQTVVVEETTLEVADSYKSKVHRRKLQVSTPSNQYPLRVVLCWTDPPGSYNFNTDDTRPNLVHNLEIRIIDPLGNQHFPYVMPFANTFNESDLGLPAIKAENNVDNVEVIEIENPLPGKYTMEIFAKGELIQAQSYSVVLQGLEQAPDQPDPNADEYQTWAENHFGMDWKNKTNTLPNDDFDGDGQTNSNEFFLGTNPTDVNSKLQAKIIKMENAPNKPKKVTIKISPVVDPSLGLTRMVSSPNLSGNTWTGPTHNVHPNQEGENTEVELTIELENEASQFFFKAEFSPVQKIVLP